MRLNAEQCGASRFVHVPLFFLKRAAGGPAFPQAAGPEVARRAPELSLRLRLPCSLSPRLVNFTPHLLIPEEAGGAVEREPGLASLLL